MKKITLFLSLLLAIASSKAQEYQISFAGNGESTTVDSVTVENLTQGIFTSLKGIEVLHLSGTWTDRNVIPDNGKEIRIYPNPMMGNTTIDFFATTSGITEIELFDITGKRIITAQDNLTIGLHSFKVSGLSSGIYMLRIRSQSYSYTGKLVSNDASSSEVKISYLGNSEILGIAKRLKSAQAEKMMHYNTGDRLKITGISGIYSTVITDIPTENKTLTFEFVECTDGDGNNYPVVQIGTQLWMAKNLETTNYNDGTNIPNVVDDTEWHNLVTPGYCWYNNDIANKNKYGALYNWYVKDKANFCPKGWHVPLDAEWTTLINFLGGASVAGDKLLETGAHWSWWTGATNETGFSALPGGYRPSIFYDIGDNGYWWGSTAGYTFAAWYSEPMHFGYTYVYRVTTRLSDGFSVRCVRDGVFIPVLRTTTASSTSDSSAICEVNISFNGYTTITTSGVCWNTTGSPTIADNKTIDGNGTGLFTSSLTGLTGNTTYYLRGYSTNNAGTGYGNELILKTFTGIVKDIEDNVYNTVTIGTQVWMIENLKTTKYNDGTSIPNVTDKTAWSNLTTPSYCWYKNDESNKNTYGALYNWYTVNTGKLCPAGWHVHTYTEWTTLTDYFGNNQNAYYKLRETGTVHWISPDKEVTNESGFTALPGGYINDDGAWSLSQGGSGAWWSSTQDEKYPVAMRWTMSGQGFVRGGSESMKMGLSVRCIKD